MAITTVDGLLAAMTSGTRQKTPIAVAAVATQITGGNTSYWRSAGTPMGQGAVPSAAATCNNATLGGLIYNNPSAGSSTYLARLGLLSSTVSAIEMHDRIAHMGGLSGVVTTAQTVGLSLVTLAGVDNVAARIGRGDYSVLQWWLEWYTATGATATVATITYTNHNGVTGKTATVAIPASTAAGRMIQIIPANGDNIRSIETVTLSVTTGTAGSFGVTVSLERTSIPLPVANNMFVMDWAALALPLIYDSSCLFFICDTTTTSAGTLGGSLTLVQG